MEEILLEAEIRDEIGSAEAKTLRHGGFIPAIVYSQGTQSLAIKLGHKRFLQLVHQYRAESIVIKLQVKDDKKQEGRLCVIKEIQYDPVHEHILHVDFHEISLTKAIKVNVPIEAKGESIGVKLEGGSLEHILWEAEVECLPTDIPKRIEVEIGQLKLGESIHVKDLVLPANVKILNDPSSIVLTVSSPMKEEAAVPEEGEVSQEPEVIKEKKEVPAEGQEEPKEKEKKEKK
ncbi:MAG: 50S ribosomal protein L25 [Candidatus Omnitrophica bacterium]|nr:50S ribosomal protein L25 [Candidatus Omnitrophota bacterium]